MGWSGVGIIAFMVLAHMVDTTPLSWGGVGMITFDEVQIELFQVRHCLVEFSCCDNTKRYKKVKRSKLAHRVWIRIGATSKILSPKMKSPKKTFLVS